jgi:hypothetical protein
MAHMLVLIINVGQGELKLKFHHNNHNQCPKNEGRVTPQNIVYIKHESSIR